MLFLDTCIVTKLVHKKKNLILSILILGSFFVLGEAAESVEGASLIINSSCEDTEAGIFLFSCYYECESNPFALSCLLDCGDNSTDPSAPPCDPKCDELITDPLLSPCDPECNKFRTDPSVSPCDPKCDELITDPLLSPCDPECNKFRTDPLTPPCTIFQCLKSIDIHRNCYPTFNLDGLIDWRTNP
jgi:hypothetical protein